jgi:hypothetical protein
MNSTKTTGDYQRHQPDFLPLVGLLLLVLYNLTFFIGKFVPSFLPTIVAPVFSSFKANTGFLTVLELIGVSGVFVDFIVRYDLLGQRGIAVRRLRLMLTALLVIGFFFKLFINYVDSAYLAP